MNKSRKGVKVLALLLGASLLAAACGDDDDGDAADTTTAAGGDTTAAEGGDTTAAEGGDTTAAAGGDTTAAVEGGAGGTVVYGYEQEFRAFNNNTSAEAAVQNQIVLNQILPNPFVFASHPDGTVELVLNEDLMVSAEVTSEDPQVVEYVVNPDAVWSDGEPIDCDDFYLAWLAGRGDYKQTNPDGSVVTDPETGAEILLFDTQGTTGWDQIQSTECSADGKTITQTFDPPYPDWQGLYTPATLLPAHIVEAQGGVDDIIAADEEAKSSGDASGLADAATFWSTGWVFNPGDIDPAITPSGGPYQFGTWEPGASVTLVPNEAYWGPAPKASEVVIRFIPQEAQAQALANGEIMAMDPQPNVELVNQLSGMSGVSVSTGEQFTYEHLDFNFNVPAFQDRNVREAFALCVPRQQILDSLIIPQNPEAVVANNRWIYTFEDVYQDNSDGKYLEPDIEQSSALLEEAGQTGLTVRIGYRTPNQRRTDTVALIKASCDQAGFNILDAGTDTFFGVELAQGDFDVALFGWAGSTLKTGTSSTFQTGGGNNNGNYSNPEVDDLVTQLNTTLDQDGVIDLANQIDLILWEDLVTLPLFTFPAISAVSDSTSGVVFNPTQYGLTWNAQEWAAA